MQIGALTYREELTALGAVLSLLPVEAHVGKLLVLASLLQVWGCVGKCGGQGKCVEHAWRTAKLLTSACHVLPCASS